VLRQSVLAVTVAQRRVSRYGGWITGKQDRTASLDVGSWFGDKQRIRSAVNYRIGIEPTAESRFWESCRQPTLNAKRTPSWASASASPCWQQLTFHGKENKCKPKLPIRGLRPATQSQSHRLGGGSPTALDLTAL
jgi:hypothetical protein